MGIKKKDLLVAAAVVAVAVAGGGLTTNVWVRGILKAVMLTAFAMLALRTRVTNRTAWILAAAGGLLGAVVVGGLDVGWLTPTAAVMVMLVWVISVAVLVKRSPRTHAGR